MTGVSIQIVRFVERDQPNIIEAELIDAYGRAWRFIDKEAIFSCDSFDEQSIYPQPGVIACEILERRKDDSGREIVKISTDKPWSVESNEGETVFEVFVDLLIEWT